MIDFVGIQNDIWLAILNKEELASVNVLQYRQYKLLSEVDRAKALLAPRNGRCGAMIMVEMPLVRVQRPNLPGPEMQLVVPVSVAVQPSINDSPATGTLLDAEEIGEWTHDCVHGLRLYGTRGYQMASDENAMSPVRSIGGGQIVVGEGTLAYQSRFFVRISRSQTLRTDPPTITLNGDGTASLSAGPNFPDAEVWYTLDGHWPSKVPTAGVPSVKYTGPFAVATGQKVRAASYKAGYNVAVNDKDVP